MDLQGITWVGHMYQKFETMCLEVEEVMYQDTVKFVEDQVQTVSTNVKRFYSDVLQDLADPSIEAPVKDSHKFPKVVSRPEPRKIEGKTNRKPLLDQNLCAENLRPPSEETMNKHLTRVSSLSEQPNEKFEAWHEVPVSVGLGLDSVRKSFDEINNASEVATSALNDAVSPGIVGTEEMKMALSFSSDLLAASYERPDERTLDIMSSAVLDMETCQQLEIEESCHIVNGAELPIMPQKEKKQKAYKMRIRDAISSKMRSTRKQEYKQLAVSFEEHGKSKQGSDEHSGSIICETEWEIL